MSRAETLDDVIAVSDEIVARAHDHGIRSIAVYGSFFKGTQHADSDVDFLVLSRDLDDITDPSPLDAVASYQEFLALERELSTLLGRPIGVVAARDPFTDPDVKDFAAGRYIRLDSTIG